MALYKIQISPLANKTYEENIDYLESRWTQKEIIHFITKVSDVVSILKTSPSIFQKWHYDTTIHKVEILKQITLYYQIIYNEVHLLLFWNNLQDPNDLAKFL